MSRITGSEVASMMEAYNAVYAPQELTEEQAWQEVEEWVNSLVEEGYDLSEYTWEDMYEEYITEIGVNFGGQAAVNRVLSQASGGGGRIGQPGSAGMVDYKNKAGQVKSAYKSSSDGKLYKNYNDALAAKNSRMQGLAVQQGLNRTYRAGGGNAAVAQGRSPLDVMKQGATNLGAQQRPATPTPSAARPVQPPVGGQRPATPTPSAARPAQPPVAGQRPATPTPSGSAPTSRPGGFGVPTAPLAARSSVSSATAPGSVPSGTSVAVKPATAAAPTSRPSLASQTAELQQMRKASQQRIMAQGGKPATPLVQSFDLFDVVMGHLIDEGYADSEEAALTIMANMSEEWKQSIVEAGRMHSASDQQASWHSQNTENNSTQENKIFETHHLQFTNDTFSENVYMTLSL